jgi:hypothetical protein
MRTAAEIAKSYSELEGLKYLRKRADDKESKGLDFSFNCAGADGVSGSVSETMVRQATLAAYRDALDRAIENVQKRFKEAGIPLE